MGPWDWLLARETLFSLAVGAGPMDGAQQVADSGHNSNMQDI